MRNSALEKLWTVSAMVVAPSDTPPAPRLYVPTLDGLRLCAFVLVFIHHLPRSSSPVVGMLHDFGWVGVQVFLTLSAYLLTMILCAEQKTRGEISVGRFYIRRGLRIWPLYFVFVAAMFIHFCVRSHVAPYDFLRLCGLLFFVDNVMSGIWNYNTIPYTGHLWTISLEEQFYLVLPFLLRGWLQDKRKAVTRILGIWVSFVALRSLFVLLGAPHPFIWTSIIGGDAILFGTILGIVQWKPPNTLLARSGCLVAGLLGTFSAVAFPSVGNVGPHQVVEYTTIAVGTTLLCVCAVHEPLLRFLGARPLRYLGKISYGLYVFHVICIAAAQVLCARVGLRGWLPTAGIALAVTIATSVASYELLEKPFLRLKSRFETVHTRPV